MIHNVIIRSWRGCDQVRNACRVGHLNLQTEKAYVHWIRRFIIYHGRRHPRDLGFSTFERARRPKWLPVVLTHDEVKQILAELTGTDKLIALPDALSRKYPAAGESSFRLHHRPVRVDDAPLILHPSIYVGDAQKGQSPRITEQTARPHSMS